MAGLSKDNYGRVFEVIKGSMGPWSQGHKFSEFEFRRIHPAPEHIGDEKIDPEKYWQSLLNRMIDAPPAGIGCIREVANGKPDPTPDGPEANPPMPYRSPLSAQPMNEMASKVDQLTASVATLVEAVKPALMKAK